MECDVEIWVVEDIEPVDDALEFVKEVEPVDDTLVLVKDVEPVDDTLEFVKDVEPVDDTMVLVEREVSLYNSSLFAAPQYSVLSPGQSKLHSPIAVRADPPPRELPQVPAAQSVFTYETNIEKGYSHSSPFSTPKYGKAEQYSAHSSMVIPVASVNDAPSSAFTPFPSV
jgi:hypothetical protein